MASEIEICNIALSNIRGKGIGSFTENTVQAQQCALKYPILRDRCLKETAWIFNRKIEPLALLSEVDVFTYPFAYAYPTDCLKIQRLVSAHEEVTGSEVGVGSRFRSDERIHLQANYRHQIPYEVFNVDNVKVIGANMDELRVDYSAKVTDPNLFSDDFIMALSHLLAAEIAIPIVGADLGRALRQESLNIYEEYMSTAIADDSNDRYTGRRESQFITIRR